MAQENKKIYYFLRNFFGQNVTSEQYYPTTPVFANTNETQALRDVSQLNVNYSAGAAIVNLPIYTIDGGNINLPVNFNYAATGIKVEDEALWVG